jgi:GNAT superfamily N-acetyltransferase
MSEVEVRIATPADLDQVMSMCMSATEENGFVSASPMRLLEQVWPALNQQEGLVGVIEGENGELEGGILLRISHMWYSDDFVIEEKAIFVRPEFRSAKGGRARKLAEFAKSVSDKMGLPLAIGVLSNTRTEAKVRLYQRVFGEPAGVYFLYNGKTGIVPETKG